MVCVAERGVVEPGLAVDAEAGDAAVGIDVEPDVGPVALGCRAAGSGARSAPSVVSGRICVHAVPGPGSPLTLQASTEQAGG